jgi:hypothetical protein
MGVARFGGVVVEAVIRVQLQGHRAAVRGLEARMAQMSGPSQGKVEAKGSSGPRRRK